MKKGPTISEITARTEKQEFNYNVRIPLGKRRKKFKNKLLYSLLS